MEVAGVTQCMYLKEPVQENTAFYLVVCMGQRTLSNFSTPGRAGGGYSEAGTSLIVGERGPEMITLQVPVNFASAGDSKGSVAPVNMNNTYHMQACVSQGVDEFLKSNSKGLREALEVEMHANSQSIDNFG
jgi:hypothetical protein